MKTINTIDTQVIAKAAMEAGIRADEKYSAAVISREGSLIGFVIETEWNRITCYADEATGEVFGIMTEPKELSELTAESRISANARPVRRRSAVMAA